MADAHYLNWDSRLSASFAIISPLKNPMGDYRANPDEALPMALTVINYSCGSHQS